MSLDAERAAGLAKTKLAGLVQRAFPDIVAEADTFRAGAGLVQGDRAFVYLVAETPSPLGAVLAWGQRRGAAELHLIVDQPDPVLDIMAKGLTPQPQLWQAVGTELVPMARDVATSRTEPPAAALDEAPLLVGAGCEVVVEHGVVTGEILGLEVARVVVEPDQSALVRVGVGLYDQEAHALMNFDAPADARLEQVVAEVRSHRRGDGTPHPINRAARERWLRAMMVADPALVGLDQLSIVEPLVPRGGIREATPVAARGKAGGANVLVVCSTGIDLDLVPVAGGHLGIENPDRVVLVLPERDHHSVIRQMATHLSVPAVLTHIPDPWP